MSQNYFNELDFQGTQLSDIYFSENKSTTNMNSSEIDRATFLASLDEIFQDYFMTYQANSSSYAFSFGTQTPFNSNQFDFSFFPQEQSSLDIQQETNLNEKAIQPSVTSSSITKLRQTFKDSFQMNFTQAPPEKYSPQSNEEVSLPPSKQFKPGLNKRAVNQIAQSPDDEQFFNACSDQFICVNPCKMGFLPKEFWRDQYYTFGQLVHDHFQKRNHPKCRFSHKLHNALKLADAHPELIQYIGVEWKTKYIIHVQRDVFGRLLGIKNAEEGLFHKQGNFSSFSFVELSYHQVMEQFGSGISSNYDLAEHRYVYHKDQLFYDGCPEEELDNNLEWVKCTKR